MVNLDLEECRDCGHMGDICLPQVPTLVFYYSIIGRKMVLVVRYVIISTWNCRRSFFLLRTSTISCFSFFLFFDNFDFLILFTLIYRVFLCSRFFVM